MRVRSGDGDKFFDFFLPALRFFSDLSPHG
jgi:hypothetical protein